MTSEIRKELLAIDPVDELERDHITDALAWVDSGADLFRISKPDHPPKHLVSYFVLIDGQYILLVDHKKAELWLPTGGHVESGEHPRETVEREIEEELGITLSLPIGPPLMVTCTETVGRTSGHTDVSLWYVVNVPRSRSLCYDRGEFHDARWFARDEIPYDQSDPHMIRFIKKLDAVCF